MDVLSATPNSPSRSFEGIPDEELVTDEHERLPGQLYWGRTKGYPWWPALVINRADVPEIVLKDGAPELVVVKFLATEHFGWFHPKDLLPYRPNLSKLKKQPCTNSQVARGLLRAIATADEFEQTHLHPSMNLSGGTSKGIIPDLNSPTAPAFTKCSFSPVASDSPSASSPSKKRTADLHFRIEEHSPKKQSIQLIDGDSVIQPGSPSRSASLASSSGLGAFNIGRKKVGVDDTHYTIGAATTDVISSFTPTASAPMPSQPLVTAGLPLAPPNPVPIRTPESTLAPTAQNIPSAHASPAGLKPSMSSMQRALASSRPSVMGTPGGQHIAPRPSLSNSAPRPTVSSSLTASQYCRSSPTPQMSHSSPNTTPVPRPGSAGASPVGAHHLQKIRSSAPVMMQSVMPTPPGARLVTPPGSNQSISAPVAQRPGASRSNNLSGTGLTGLQPVQLLANAAQGPMSAPSSPLASPSSTENGGSHESLHIDGAGSGFGGVDNSDMMHVDNAVVPHITPSTTPTPPGMSSSMTVPGLSIGEPASPTSSKKRLLSPQSPNSLANTEFKIKKKKARQVIAAAAAAARWGNRPMGGPGSIMAMDNSHNDIQAAPVHMSNILPYSHVSSHVSSHAPPARKKKTVFPPLDFTGLTPAQIAIEKKKQRSAIAAAAAAARWGPKRKAQQQAQQASKMTKSISASTEDAAAAPPAPPSSSRYLPYHHQQYYEHLYNPKVKPADELPPSSPRSTSSAHYSSKSQSQVAALMSTLFEASQISSSLASPTHHSLDDLHRQTPDTTGSGELILSHMASAASSAASSAAGDDAGRSGSPMTLPPNPMEPFAITSADTLETDDVLVMERRSSKTKEYGGRNRSSLSNGLLGLYASAKQAGFAPPSRSSSWAFSEYSTSRYPPQPPSPPRLPPRLAITPVGSRRIQVRRLPGHKSCKRVGVACPNNMTELLKVVSEGMQFTVVEIWDAALNGVEDINYIMGSSGNVYFALSQEDLEAH
mmetsp:Transcript_9211/g.15139  ORF Transcript_9211/g.15139 Transcript_9211/m.15139 type:complete len:994 (-) Transcript_9211:108-3089(-)